MVTKFGTNGMFCSVLIQINCSAHLTHSSSTSTIILGSKQVIITLMLCIRVMFEV